VYSCNSAISGSIDPYIQTMLFVAPFEKDDYMVVTVKDMGDATKINEGSTLAMVKIDGIGGSKPMDTEFKRVGSGGLAYAGSGGYRERTENNSGVSPTDDEISDAHILDTHKPRVAGAQRDKISGSQVPFSATGKSARHLRGRTIAYSPILGGKK